MIFLLHGADSFRRQQKLNELKQRFMSAIDSLGQSLIILDGSQTSDAELQEKISSGLADSPANRLKLFGNTDTGYTIGAQKHKRTV